MRTTEQVLSNVEAIRAAMTTVEAQIKLLDKEYQANAVESIGERRDEWEEMINRLKAAWHDLNNMWHMEVDYADYLIHGDNE